jgi:hypothetical protein
MLAFEESPKALAFFDRIKQQPTMLEKCFSEFSRIRQSALPQFYNADMQEMSRLSTGLRASHQSEVQMLFVSALVLHACFLACICVCVCYSE